MTDADGGQERPRYVTWDLDAERGPHVGKAAQRVLWGPVPVRHQAQQAHRQEALARPIDQGPLAPALKDARRIDAAEDGKAAGHIGQNVSGVICAPGGVPAERKALGVQEQVAGELAAPRAGRR